MAERSVGPDEPERGPVREQESSSGEREPVRRVGYEPAPAARPSAETGLGERPSGTYERDETALRVGEPDKGPSPSRVVDQLNDFLRGELSAVETYDLALRSVRDAELATALRNIRDNHDRRVTLLRERIRTLGGEPVHGSGVWGAIAKLVQRGADLFGDKAAIAVLEEGEDRCKKMYSDFGHLDASTRELVATQIAPEQQRTHDLCSSLHRMTKAA